MGQQPGIIVVIDIPAAIEGNTLDGNIWLVDNGGWDGSTGEGSPHLVSAIDATDAALDPGNAILNWLIFGIGTIPITVPQTFFVKRDGAEAFSESPLPASPSGFSPVRTRSLVGDDATAGAAGSLEAPQADPNALLPGRGIVDPGTARFKRTGESRVAQPDDQTLVYYPDPVILRLYGEAFEAGVIYPAQYGSPAILSPGLYWSASVDPNRLGLYRYTMDIALYYSRRDAGGTVIPGSVVLSHDAWVRVSTGAPRNAFNAGMLDLRPAAAAQGG